MFSCLFGGSLRWCLRFWIDGLYAADCLVGSIIVGFGFGCFWFGLDFASEFGRFVVLVGVGVVCFGGISVLVLLQWVVRVPAAGFCGLGISGSCFVGGYLQFVLLRVAIGV